MLLPVTDVSSMHPATQQKARYAETVLAAAHRHFPTTYASRPLPSYFSTPNPNAFITDKTLEKASLAQHSGYCGRRTRVFKLCRRGTQTPDILTWAAAPISNARRWEPAAAAAATLRTSRPARAAVPPSTAPVHARWARHTGVCTGVQAVLLMCGGSRAFVLASSRESTLLSMPASSNCSISACEAKVLYHWL